MAFVQQGQTVTVHYTGRLADGSIFDTSDGGDAIEFEVGAGQVIAGLDRALAGMAVGERKTVHIPCADAYGPINLALRAPMPRSAFPANVEPELGMPFHVHTPQGEPVEVRIVGITPYELTLDANHPLAGKDLTFDIELVAVR